MTPVVFHFVTPNGVPIADTPFEIQLSKSAFHTTISGVLMPRLVTAMTGADGKATVSLWPSDALYYVTVYDKTSDAALNYKFYVPVMDVGVTQVLLQDIVVSTAMSNTTYDAAALLAIFNSKVSAAASRIAALASEVASAASAASASASQTSSTASAATATTQAGISTTKAAESAASAAAALASENAALASKNTATTQATNASASAAAALASQNAAAISQTSAATKAAEALASQGAAATSAGNSASSATASAGFATNSSNSAATASTQAGNAAASAASVVRDGSGGVAGLTLFKLNLRNALNTLTSFLVNSNTVARTYTLQDRDGTLADNTDLALKANAANPTFTGTATGLTQAMVGLGSVNNTPDTDKPVSTAQQTALNGKATLGNVAPDTHAALEKTLPVDADELPLIDSAATWALKRLTWASLKATLKTYFDAIYPTKTSGTGSLQLPAGTTAQRDGVPGFGATRANSTLNQTEWWNGTAWSPMGGGATGAPGNYAFVENDQTVTGNYTLTAGKNALSAGPISINTGVAVTVPTGATWSIV